MGEDDGASAKERIGCDRSPPSAAASPARQRVGGEAGEDRRSEWSYQRLAVQWALAGLLLVACVFMIYLTLLVRRLTVTIEVMSEDLAQVMATTARVAEDVDRVEERVRVWYESFGVGKVAGAVDELARVARGLTGEAVERPAAADEEIRFLLSEIARSKATFEYAGREQSAAALYARLYAKYKAYENTLASAEDFIDRVASKSLTGKPYYATEPGGERVELGEWLRAKLAARRAGGAR